MLDAENPTENTAADTSPETTTAPDAAAAEAPAKKTTAKKTTAKKTTAKKTTAKKTATKKTAASAPAEADAPTGDAPIGATGDTAGDAAEPAPAKKTATKKTAAKKTATKKSPAKRTTKKAAAAEDSGTTDAVTAEAAQEPAATPPPATALLFQPPDPTKAQPRKKKAAPKPEPEAETAEGTPEETPAEPKPKQARKQAAKKSQKQTPKAEDAEDKDAKPAEPAAADDSEDRDFDDEGDEQGGGRRRRRRGGRRRRKSGEGNGDDTSDGQDDQNGSGDDSGNRESDSDSGEGGSSSSRRRRRRRRTGDDDTPGDDPQNTVTRVRKPRAAEDEITALSGSTRLEAKKQRRREGREAGRRRAPIVSEAEFLARREAVERVMVIRQKKDLTQIAVLEDKVLVEHYVARESQTSLIGNVYLGRVQNVLPSMEAAFIDIGKGRNAVLYAGEVNWSSLGAKDGQPRKIESVLKSGQPILVQVSKDPIGHKGARLTSQISLPGRFLVYVPDGTTSGISRKLPDTERSRLKTLLKEIVPDTAGVIVRTAAEGASEDELTRDVERLKARWEDIESKISGGSAPQLLYGEPDLTLKVVRDLFTEDFDKLVVSGDEAWDMVEDYVQHLAPDLEERLEKYSDGDDVFAAYRIDEQIAKGLDRKVWLPSGGSLVIDRTEAMTVVDVNTGKFTGSGGNLEETVTKNNLEAAEEIVRQLRLRDIGGIIVVDFIDMVLESNRDLVLRRMVECLGRDRTRHQVAEVTSLGLVQMTRKRIGTGLLEAFSEDCDHCQGRGLIVHHEPVEQRKKGDDDGRRGRRGGRKGGRDDNGAPAAPSAPSPKDIAAMAKADQRSDTSTADTQTDGAPVQETPADDSQAGVSRTGDEQSGNGRPSRRSARTRRGGSDQPSEQPAAHGAAEDSGSRATDGTGEPAAEPAQESAQESAGQEPATKPVRTRKRAARREQAPAGQPVQLSAAEEPTAEAASSDAVAADGPGSAPETPADAAGGTSDGTPAETPAPKVVATVRRRGAARRPAGPPPGVTAGETTSGTATATVTAPSGDGAAGPSGDSTPAAEVGDPDQLPVDEVPEQAAPVHVPVKKKGSRKR
ncbi:MAG TPA: Rne/Rng family ribonuclease [Nocardioidaceae bacterium]|nr:Rne/Rng family ribonuclease [Nocardioidaceae bacterium]